MRASQSRVWFGLCLCLCFGIVVPALGASKQQELDAALKKLDMKLYEQSEVNVRAWLDKAIDIYGDFGAMNSMADGTFRIGCLTRLWRFAIS